MVKSDDARVRATTTDWVLCHTTPVVRHLVFDALNVQSANNKIDEIMDVRCEHALDVMLLSETWHDGDSVSIRRVRAKGLQVLEHACPRIRPASLRVNAVSLDGGQRVSSFQHLCAWLVVHSSACTVLLVYHPGSVAVDSTFFEELSSLLDQLVTRSVPVIVAGNFNIRLDRPDDHRCRHLLDVLSAHGLQCRVSSPTHDRGGILDVVATRADLTALEVSVLEVGISDHRLLHWISQLERPPPVYHTSTYRLWRRINLDEFKATLRQSTLCAVSIDGDNDDADVDTLADQYTGVITSIADRLVPMKSVTCRRRASNVWFDDECCAAHKKCRWLERRCNRSPAYKKQWRSEFQHYRQLTHRK